MVLKLSLGSNYKVIPYDKLWAVPAYIDFLFWHLFPMQQFCLVLYRCICARRDNDSKAFAVPILRRYIWEACLVYEGSLQP